MLNETEIKLYAQSDNLLAGARRILELGPKALIVKRGEYGAMLVTRGASIRESFFIVPAYPVATVIDPTGAGDTFAAGFMGYLAKSGDLSIAALRRAVVHGTIVASFTVQDFSVDRLRNLTLDEIDSRYDDIRCLTHFESAPIAEPSFFQRPF